MQLSTRFEERISVLSISERYRSATHTLYDQAMVELEAGDLWQASEKFWGATAQVLKSFAEKEGLEHDSHSHAYGVIREAVRSSRNPKVGEWFKQRRRFTVIFAKTGWLKPRSVLRPMTCED